MMSLLAKVWRKLSFSKLLQLRIMRIFNDEFLIGVTGIIFDKDDKILLVKHTYRKVKWGLPGGYLKAKEYPTEGLERELEEETGLLVSADRLFKLRTDRETGRLDLCYIGVYIGGIFKKSSEVDEYGLFSEDELPDIMRDQVLLIHEAIAYRKKKSMMKHP